MGRSRGLRRTGTAAGAVVLITLTACGSSAPAANDERVDISTWRAGTESGTARIAGRSTTTEPGKPDQVAEWEGEVDFDRHRSVTRTRATEGKHAGRSVESRSIDDTLFINDPEMSGSRDRPWTRLAFAWGAAQWLASLDGLLDGSSARPGTEVTRTGTDTVRGEPVTVYRVGFAPHVPPRLLARGYPIGISDLEIAVDRDGRIRRVRYALDQVGDTVVRNETEYYDFGAPVSVEPPPADQIDTSGSGAEPPIATGPWTDLATDGEGPDRVVVSAVATDQGVCFGYDATVPGDVDWWTVAGRAADHCIDDDLALFETGQVNLRPIATDLQILTGQFDRGTTAVTLHLDDGSTVAVTPHQGAFASIVRGNRVVERVEATVPAGTATCEFAPQESPLVYRCSGDVSSIPPDIAETVPSFETTPTT